MADPVKLYGASYRSRPGLSADGGEAPLHTGLRGDLGTLPMGKALSNAALEGSYFAATNPTVGTGIAGIAAADGYNAEETLYYLRNAATAADGIWVIPDFIELACTVVDTNGTNILVSVHVDSASRFVSGGSAITPVNTNMGSSVSSSATLRFGAVVTSTTTTDRLIYSRLISSTDLVADDIIRFDFGNQATGALQVLNNSEHATLGRMFNIGCPPVVLGPGTAMIVSVNCASQSGAATWSFATGWVER